MTRFILSCAVLTALSATAVFAESLVEELDADGSGGLSLPELQLAYPEMAEASFALIDINGDGEADAEEVTAAVESGLLLTSG